MTSSEQINKMLENQQKHMDKILEEDKLSNSLDPSNMLKIVRLAFPNTVKSDLVKEFAMGGIHKYELIKSKGKKFVESFEVWLRQFDTDSTEDVVYGNRDEDYDIKGIKVKQYMLERL